MYEQILEHHDYAKHGPEMYAVQCWHKRDHQDICVDNSNGFWAIDTPEDISGYDAFSLLAYLLRSGVDNRQI